MEARGGSAKLPAQVGMASAAERGFPGVARKPRERALGTAHGHAAGRVGKAADMERISVRICARMLMLAKDLDAGAMAGDGVPALRAQEPGPRCAPGLSYIQDLAGPAVLGPGPQAPEQWLRRYLHDVRQWKNAAILQCITASVQGMWPGE